MPMKVLRFSVTTTVKIFTGVPSPWVYVLVPREQTEATRLYADRGLVAIRVTLGESEWDTSLMPMGDGSQFIPLSSKVRKREGIEVGDRVSLSYHTRKR